MSRISRISTSTALWAIAGGVAVIAFIPAMFIYGAFAQMRDAHSRVEARKAEAAIAPAPPAPRLIAGKDAFISGPCQFSILSAKFVGSKVALRVEYRVNSLEKKLDLLTPTYWSQGIKIVDEFGNNYELDRRDNYAQVVIAGKPYEEWWRIEAPIPAAKSILLDLPSTIIDGSREKIMRFELPISFISK